MKLEMFISSVTGVTLLVLNGHMWPVASVLDSTALSCFYIPVSFVDAVAGPDLEEASPDISQRDGWMDVWRTDRQMDAERRERWMEGRTAG